MGMKLLWTGLTCYVAANVFSTIVPQLEIVAGIIMIIGVILYWLDR